MAVSGRKDAALPSLRFFPSADFTSESVWLYVNKAMKDKWACKDNNNIFVPGIIVRANQGPSLHKTLFIYVP